MRSRLLGALIVVAGALGTVRAHAQSAEDLKRAQALFDQGSHLVNAGRYQEACPSLEAAQRLVAGIGVTLYLGECYEQTGRLKGAWEQYRKAEELAGAKKDPRERVAHDHAALLWPRLAKLRIVLEEGVDYPGLVITDEGRPVERSDWGAERPVDPRTHHLRAEAPQRQAWELAIDVPATAGTISVQVPLLKEAAPPNGGAVTPSPAEESSSASASGVPSASRPLPPSASEGQGLGAQRIAGIAVLGAGVVGVGVGTIFGLEAKAKFDDSNSSGRCQPDDRCNSAGLAERSDALTAAMISSVGFVAGAVCLAGGAALYLTAPARRSGVALVPRSERRGASLLLEGRW